MGHATINQKAAIVAETGVKPTLMAAAMAEAHTMINQKAAAIAAEMAVKVAAMGQPWQRQRQWQRGWQ